ncbi:MAG TPA: hypothetical protein VNB29_06585 [Chthoniobacterales bacterium]|jgi:hypothetical protein|nr:hypothetical protein [Chthoniobacterales bacterium]
MKADPFLSELAILTRTKREKRASSVRGRQKQMQRLHVTAFRRAMRRLRELRGPALGESLA